MSANLPGILKLFVLAAVCSGCGSNLKMRLGEPLQVSRGYAIDDTRFYQRDQEVNAADVKRKLGNETAAADSVASGKTFDALAFAARVPGAILLAFGIDGLIPNSQIKMSKGTTVGLLSGGAALIGLSVGFALGAESNYVDAVAQHNARFSSAAHRESNESAAAPSNVASQREEFPHRVADYAFGMRVSDAEGVCRRAAQQWNVNGSDAQCVRTERSSKDAVEVHLRFALGALSAITVVYRSSPGVLNRDYAHLSSAFRAKYGKPQVEPARPSGSCATALAACLAEGEKVKAMVWSWARGSVELEPVWRDERAQIEVRYLQQDGGGQ
jgi:hypothetical protein